MQLVDGEGNGTINSRSGSNSSNIRRKSISHRSRRSRGNIRNIIVIIISSTGKAKLLLTLCAPTGPLTLKKFPHEGITR